MTLALKPVVYISIFILKEVLLGISVVKHDIHLGKRKSRYENACFFHCFEDDNLMVFKINFKNI
jgi:hypothetical protein